MSIFYSELTIRISFWTIKDLIHTEEKYNWAKRREERLPVFKCKINCPPSTNLIISHFLHLLKKLWYKTLLFPIFYPSADTLSRELGSRNMSTYAPAKVNQRYHENYNPHEVDLQI